MCGVKGAFAEPWAQLSWLSDLSFCQKISQSIYLCPCPPELLLMFQPIETWCRTPLVFK